MAANWTGSSMATKLNNSGGMDGVRRPVGQIQCTQKEMRKMKSVEIRAVKALRAYFAHMSAKEWAEVEIAFRRIKEYVARNAADAVRREVATW